MRLHLIFWSLFGTGLSTRPPRSDRIKSARLVSTDGFGSGQVRLEGNFASITRLVFTIVYRMPETLAVIK